MSPMYDYKFLVHSNAAIGAAADEYSTDEVNFGVANPDIGRGGKFGLHIVVTEAFAGIASGAVFWIIHGAATAPTTKHIGRFFTAAQLALGKHFFIPGGHTLLQYARMLFDESEVTTAGKVTCWFGPDEDGAE